MMKRRIGFGVDQVLSDIAFQYHLKDQNTGWLLVGQSWLTVASLTENHHWWPLKEVHRPLGFMCVPLHVEETDDSHWPPIFAVPCTRAQLRHCPVFPHHTPPSPAPSVLGLLYVISCLSPSPRSQQVSPCVCGFSLLNMTKSRPTSSHLASSTLVCAFTLAQNFYGHLCVVSLYPYAIRHQVHFLWVCPRPPVSCCSSKLVALLLTVHYDH